jgi:voltage-gated potassium channel
MKSDRRRRARWRDQLNIVVNGTDTPAGRGFDVVLLVLILASVLVVMIESVPSIAREHAWSLRVAEWSFTAIFTVEYFLRLASVPRARRYALSFLGFVDLMAILPAYLGLVFTGAHSLAVVRALRLLRVFRILKLTHYLGEARTLGVALRASRVKITVFLFTVIVIVVIVGTLMYVVEGPKSGFNSIPLSMYWAIVTLTTVGYGDIAPVTVVGRFIASLLMILGYGIIAVPTGIVSAEMVRAVRGNQSPITCPRCGKDTHETDARHCSRCGERLVQ